MELKKKVSNLAPWNWFKHENNQDLPLQRSEPSTDPLARMHHEMDRLFDQTLRSAGFPSLFGQRTDALTGEGGLLRPSIDITERENAYVITVEVPGIKEEDVKLTLEAGTLIVSGEKRSEHESRDDGKVHRIERSYGQFQRILSLPDDAKADDAKAKFRNGVLTISIPRDHNKHVDRKHIEIESQ